MSNTLYGRLEKMNVNDDEFFLYVDGVKTYRVIRRVPRMASLCCAALERIQGE